eukprot:2047836-Alexandrium_andersonii.AAC.1
MFGSPLIGEMVCFCVTFAIDVNNPCALRFPGDRHVVLPTIMEASGGITLQCKVLRVGAVRRAICP